MFALYVDSWVPLQLVHQLKRSTLRPHHTHWSPLKELWWLKCKNDGMMPERVDCLMEFTYCRIISRQEKHIGWDNGEGGAKEQEENEEKWGRKVWDGQGAGGDSVRSSQGRMNTGNQKTDVSYSSVLACSIRTPNERETWGPFTPTFPLCIVCVSWCTTSICRLSQGLAAEIAISPRLR